MAKSAMGLEAASQGCATHRRQGQAAGLSKERLSPWTGVRQDCQGRRQGHLDSLPHLPTPASTARLLSCHRPRPGPSTLSMNCFLEEVTWSSLHPFKKVEQGDLSTGPSFSTSGLCELGQLFVPQFPHLSNREDSNTSRSGFVRIK